MAIIPTAARAALLALALLTPLAGCDQPKPRSNAGGPAGPLPRGGEPAAAPSPAGAASAEPLPAAPGWAQAYIGKPLKDALPQKNEACVGNTDAVSRRYQGAQPGVRVEGWAWEPAAKKPVARILLVEDGGKIVGAGETGLPRPDVNRARKEVTSPTTGWQAVTPTTSGGLYAFGILSDGKTACRLGHIVL